jgi:nicotinamidase-related amidase
MVRALIIIDPQPIGLEQDDAAIMVHINRLLALNWDCVVLTRDGDKPFHRSLQSCAVSAEEAANFQEVADVLWEEAWADRDPDSNCSSGAVTATMLARAAKEIHISKYHRHDGVRRPCFSAFDGVGDEGKLEDQLKERGVTEIWICGLSHEISIQSTAQDAVKLGFHTTVLYEASRCHSGTIATLTAKGVARGV